MRGLSGWAGIKAALQADTVSLIAFEVGMFAWVALTNNVWFHAKLRPDNACILGHDAVGDDGRIITAYPRIGG
jgi:hypothetical protein